MNPIPLMLMRNGCNICSIIGARTHEDPMLLTTYSPMDQQLGRAAGGFKAKLKKSEEDLVWSRSRPQGRPPKPGQTLRRFVLRTRACVHPAWD